MRKLAFIVLLALMPTLAFAAYWSGQTYSPSAAPATFTPAWQALRIGGGGLMNNIEVAPSDGTMVTSSNTYGAYLYKTAGTCAGADNGGWGSDYAAPCWEQLFTQTSAPLTLTQVTQLQQGVLEVTVCNNNTSDAYAFFNLSLWVTTNLNASAASRLWAATPLTTSITGNQGISAGTHKVIICDPANPNIVYASTSTGVHVASNGLSGASASFSALSGFGSVTLPDVMAYDGGSSAPTGTCAQFSGSPTCSKHFLIWVSGTGVYETYNGGTSFALTSGGPVTSLKQCQGGYCFSLKADQFGQFWAETGSANLYKYVPNGTAGGGTWSTSTPNVNNTPGEFALDPTSSSTSTLRIATSYGDGNISVSTNGGSTWCAWSANSFSGPNPPWFGNAQQGQGNPLVYNSTSDFAFDMSGNLRDAAGIGIWKIASASVTCGATWTADSTGIENLVSNHVDSPPGESPVVGVWDRGLWNLTNPDVFPSDYWPDYAAEHTSDSIDGGWAFDCYNFVCSGWVSGNNPWPASSVDGGATGTWVSWASRGSATINLYGQFALASPTNWLWIPAGQGAGQSQLFYTANGATSWTASNISGTTITQSGNAGIHMAADRVNANTFCLIDNSQNLWSSTNSGATFTEVNSGTISAVFYNDMIKSVPYEAGVMYYAGGNAGGSSTGYHLWKITKTTSECDTATDVNTNITNIYAMGFGAPKPGGNGFPTIYFYGALSGVQGVYELDNGGTTPTLINAPSSAQTWANNSSDFISDFSGDMNIYGRVQVGFHGSGFAYIDKQDACPWVGWENVTPNETVSGTMTLEAQQSGLLPSSLISSVNFYVDGTLIGSQTSGSGAPTTYSQSWNTSGVASGAHLLTVATSGNLTNNANCTVEAFNGTLSSGAGTVNSGTPPIVGDTLNYLGQPAGGLTITSVSGSNFTVAPPVSHAATNMIAAASMFSVPVTK